MRQQVCLWNGRQPHEAAEMLNQSNSPTQRAGSIVVLKVAWPLAYLNALSEWESAHQPLLLHHIPAKAFMIG